MKTLNTIFAKTAAKLLAFLAALMLGASVVSAGGPGIEGSPIQLLPEANFADWRPNEKDTFSVLLHDDIRSSAKGRIKMTCYSNPEDKADREMRWSINALYLDDIKKKQGGKKCHKGFVNVSVVGNDSKWRLIGRLFPCDPRDHMKFAWVTHVADDYRSGRLRSGCKHQENHYNLPADDWGGFKTLTNVPGEDRVWK